MAGTKSTMAPLLIPHSMVVHTRGELERLLEGAIAAEPDGNGPHPGLQAARRVNYDDFVLQPRHGPGSRSHQQEVR